MGKNQAEDIKEQKTVVSPQTPNADVWKIGFFVILTLVVASLAFAGLYLYLNQSKNQSLTPSPSPVASVLPVASPSPLEIPSPTPVLPSLEPTSLPSPQPSAALPEKSITEAMKENFAKKYNKNASDYEVTVGKNTGSYASGGVKVTGEMAGGWWLAAKTASGWVLVQDGNGTVSCQIIAPYNFPNSIVPECWDEQTQKIVNR